MNTYAFLERSLLAFKETIKFTHDKHVKAVMIKSYAKIIKDNMKAFRDQRKENRRCLIK